jgi:hypothetical protein
VVKKLATASPQNRQSLPEFEFDNCYAGTHPPKPDTSPPPLLRIRIRIRKKSSLRVFPGPDLSIVNSSGLRFCSFGVQFRLRPFFFSTTKGSTMLQLRERMCHSSEVFSTREAHAFKGVSLGITREVEMSARQGKFRL